MLFFVEHLVWVKGYQEEEALVLSEGLQKLFKTRKSDDIITFLARFLLLLIFPFFLFVCFSVLMLIVSFSFLFFFWNWIHDLRFYDTVILPIFLALKIFLPFLPFTQLRNISWLKEFFEVTHFVKSLLWLIKSQLHKHEKYGFLSLFFILYGHLFLFLFRCVLQGRLLNLPRRFPLKAHYEFHILVIIWFRVDYSVIILSLKFYFTIHAFINAFFFSPNKNAS